MNIDLELREILDKILEDSITDKTIESQYSTYGKVSEINPLHRFKDFVIGDLNGALRSSYSTYHGKLGSNLNQEEHEFLTQLLIQRFYGIEPAIKLFMEKNNQQNQDRLPL